MKNKAVISTVVVAAVLGCSWPAIDRYGDEELLNGRVDQVAHILTRHSGNETRLVLRMDPGMTLSRLDPRKLNARTGDRVSISFRRPKLSVYPSYSFVSRTNQRNFGAHSLSMRPTSVQENEFL